MPLTAELQATQQRISAALAQSDLPPDQEAAVLQDMVDFIAQCLPLLPKEHRSRAIDFGSNFGRRE